MIALPVPGMAYLTQDRAVDASLLKINVKKPRAIVLNPVAGIVTVALVVVGRRSTPW